MANAGLPTALLGAVVHNIEFAPAVMGTQFEFSHNPPLNFQGGFRGSIGISRGQAPYEVRLTPEEAAAGCVLPIRLVSGVTVDVTFPAGSPDGHLSTCAFGGQEIKILVRVVASRKKTQPGRSGRGARKTQQPPALPPSTAN